MIRLLSISIILLASLCLGVLLQQTPGYMLIAIGHWTIETTLWIALPSLLLFFFILHILLQISERVHAIPSALKRYIIKQRGQRAQSQTRQGLIEFSEGHWERAKNHLINALPNTDTPLLNYLTAARAAQEMGNYTLRDNYLREAQQSMPEAKIAVELTQAQLQMANHQWEQALATLKHLQDLSPHHPYVLKLLMLLYKEVRDWPQLIALLPALKRYHVLSKIAWETCEQETYLQRLTELIDQKQPLIVDTFMDELPRNLAHMPLFIALYCEYLLTQKEDRRAEEILRRALQKHFDTSLILLYGKLSKDNTDLRFIESFIKQHSHVADLYLTLGRISQNKELWGKARTYLEKSLSLSASSAAYCALGELFYTLHDTELALEMYRKATLKIHYE